MANYFKNIANFDDLKSQYRTLLKANHPDNGGDAETMKEINAEYDTLFVIWRLRREKETGKKVDETADGTRSQFYTEFGWEGKNHDWNRSLKEVAQIVRAYVKEKYPTYKFSVRTEYFSMGQELHVELKESPIEIYKTFDELTEDDFDKILAKLRYNHIFTKNCWTKQELDEAIKAAWENEGSWYKVLNEVTQAVQKDVDDFVNSYNYDDCDGMTDYFHVDFYYLGCLEGNGHGVKIVSKTARITQSKEATTPTQKHARNKNNSVNDGLELPTDYTIEESTHTKTGQKIWLVKIVRKLSKDEYIKENQKMKALNGYYSRFTHSFIFKYNPTDALKAV